MNNNNNNSNTDDISFDIDRVQFIQPVAKSSGIVSFVIKISGGLIKTKKQANYVLLGVVIVAVSISLFLVFGGGGQVVDDREEKIINPTTGEEIITENDEDILF